MPYWIEYRTLDRAFLGTYAEQPKPRPGTTRVQVDGSEPPNFPSTHFIEVDGTVKVRTPDACTRWTAAEAATYATDRKAAREAARATRATAIAALKATGSADVKKLMELLQL